MSTKAIDLRRRRAAVKWEELQKSLIPSIYIGAASCGLAAGAAETQNAVEGYLTKKGIKARIIPVGCIGPCYLEPLLDVQMPGKPRLSYSNVMPKDVASILDGFFENGEISKNHLAGHFGDGDFDGIPRFFDQPMLKPQIRIVLRNCGIIDPDDLDQYLARDGYKGFEKCLSMTWQEVLDTVKRAGLRGRGGAGFPTWRKWLTCRETESDQRYLICNADEGDPGAFMNRSLIEGDPHAVLEGMLIAASTIGASQGYVYIRAEYPLAIKRLKKAIVQMCETGLLGPHVLGSDFSFDIKIKEGAGAFVCGEETALIASIEGKRGMPRSRPPFPATSGLHGKPTIINNVETLGTLPNILRNGAEWYAGYGTETSKGTKTFSLVGKVTRTGLIEVPMGITLREVIYNIGGGTQKPFKAVQSGGPSGGCLSAEFLDLPIDYEHLAEAGSIMGSGGLIVVDSDTCIVDITKYFMDFTQKESCGKCVPCRVGTRHMVEILQKVCDGKAELSDLDKLKKLGQTVKSSSLCALGQTAANPVLSTLRYFKSEYEAHILQKKCPALVCKEIVSSPCQYQCPIGQEASTYIALVAQKRFEEAYHIIRKDNPLPSVCGRVCSRACESVCRAGESGEPISIRGLKRFVMDWAKAKGLDSPVKFPVTKTDKVAIVGAGPAGLTAGYYLVRKGYAVKIFEALPIPGGMLAVTIPSHRLPKNILREDIDYLIKSGVSIKTYMALGKDFALDDLYTQGYKAIFLATGAHRPIEIGVPGEEAEGVLQALEYLKDVHLGRPVELGAQIAIIGGGNSAVDAARVALRNKNVKKITILYRRSKKEMPAYPEEVEAALEEGVKIEFLVAPTRVRATDGKVTGVQCQRMKLGEKDESGRPKPVPIEGSDFFVPADALILALSERAYTPYLKDSDGLNLSPKWGTIIVDLVTMATTRPGVFAGGDVVTGPSSVVDAIAAGKAAAEAIENYLEGRPLVRSRQLTRPSLYVEPVVLKEDELGQTKRSKMPHLPPSKRKTMHKEIELGFTEDVAVREARRCLRCELETEDGKKAMGRET
jgi:NADH-quinone oxidoreductase subunit F